MSLIWKPLAIALGITALVLVVALAVVGTQRDKARELARTTQEAFDKTVTDYREKAIKMQADQAANIARIKSEQQAISAEVSHDYQAAIADARARYDRLRTTTAANPRSAGKAGVPQAPAAASGVDGAPEDHGFSDAERLIATEQAIRLDQLQRWLDRTYLADKEVKE